MASSDSSVDSCGWTHERRLSPVGMVFAMMDSRTLVRDSIRNRQVGVCSGVENYSRHFDGRAAGTPPHTLLDFFPDDFLLVIDEIGRAHV